jgi:hypothetical protein
MKNILIGTALLVLAGVTNAAPIVYTDEALYLADLAALGYSAIHESFEDGAVWADSRNAISSPGSTPAVTSHGIVWTSNYPQNNIATGTVGGSAPDGAFAIYSLPHGLTTDSGLYCDSAEDPNIPIECFQNDGLRVESETGDTLYAFGGRFDTANSGKVTFLLDGVDINGNDTDNIDNWQREGEPADNSTFVGVIDTDGFLSAEIRELRGKDFQQVLLFADDFTIAVIDAPVCDDGLDNDGDGLVDFPLDPGCMDATDVIEDPQCQDGINNDPGQDPDPGLIDFDGGLSALGYVVSDPDPQCVGLAWKNNEKTACGLGGFELALILPGLMRLHGRRRRRH